DEQETQRGYEGHPSRQTQSPSPRLRRTRRRAATGCRSHVSEQACDSTEGWPGVMRQRRVVNTCCHHTHKTTPPKTPTHKHAPTHKHTQTLSMYKESQTHRDTHALMHAHTHTHTHTHAHT